MSNVLPLQHRPDPYADARLAAIVDSSFDAIISKDLDSVVTSWNGAAERLFGYAADEIIGQSVLLLIPESLQSEEADTIARIGKGERVGSYETSRLRKDGRLVRVSITVSPIRNHAGEIVGASKIVRDISAAKESERRIKFLMREVNHRVKNQFAVILSMIRETSKHATDPQEFLKQVHDRIMALSKSHDLLVTSDWSGTSLFELVQEQLKPFVRDEQVSLSGPLLTLQPNAVQNLGMAFHELGTNSAKHGALSESVGRVDVTWQVSTDDAARRSLELVWDETYAAPPEPADAQPRTGFGTVVLQRVAPQSLSGRSVLERAPGHLRWTLVAPLAECIGDAD